MDPSKLPHSPQQPHVPHHPSQQELSKPQTGVSHIGSPLPGGFIPAEAWLSLAVGVIVLFMFPEFRTYLTTLSHPEHFYDLYTISDSHNQSIPFEKSVFFFTEMGLTYFGITMVLDAIVLLRPRYTVLIWIVLILNIVGVALNIFAVVKALDEAGFMIYNALAIAFGGYIALYQWRLLQNLRLS